MKELEEKIGYKFKNEKLLLLALTHSSYANEIKDKSLSNERLEFLGDSVLGIITGEYLFNQYKQFPEGELTKMRAALVCEQSLLLYSKKLGIADFVRLGKGEEQTGGRERPALLADAFEALLAALYLDGELKAVKKFFEPYLEEFAPLAVKGMTFKDYKTILQEVVQKKPGELVEYVIISEQGPDHNKVFVAQVHLNNKILGTGEGKSKKDAEQEAAKVALELLGL